MAKGLAVALPCGVKRLGLRLTRFDAWGGAQDQGPGLHLQRGHRRRLLAPPGRRSAARGGRRGGWGLTMAGTIVVGYDGSDCAKAAVRAAGTAAAAFGDRVLVVYGFGVAPLAEASDHRELLRRSGDTLLDDALEQLKSSGVEASSELVDD